MGPDGGGILGLAATVREHRGAVKADFRRFYGIGLDEAFAQWSIRELYDLIKHLPPDAALWREQAQDEEAKAHQRGEFKPGETVRTNDASTIQRFLEQALK